jgi:hypothetical protein
LPATVSLRIAFQAAALAGTEHRRTKRWLFFAGEGAADAMGATAAEAKARTAGRARTRARRFISVVSGSLREI